MYQLIIVGAGGFIGSALRYSVGELCKNQLKIVDFPLGTLFVNIVGSFLIGVVLSKPELSSGQKLFFVTGLLGGFTTYSAFSWEALELIDQQKFSIFAAYFISTVLFGLAAVYLGSKI